MGDPSSRDSLGWLENKGWVVKRVIGSGGAKEAIFLWVCVCERILLLL
jgi:hypothetical protein